MGANVNVVNNIGHSPLYIAAVRADLSFINLIVRAGCNLQLESWIRHHQFPIAISDNTQLRDYLLELVKKPLPLQALVINTVRKILKKEFDKKVCGLPIPTAMKDAITLKHVCN